MNVDDNAEESRRLLLPFHLGAVSEEDRLTIERLLLTKEELLLDYLDLKRRLEGAVEVPSRPSPALWARLAPLVRSERARRGAFVFSLGLALAAGIAALVIWAGPRETRPPKAGSAPPTSARNEVLFDSSSELPASSGVL